MALGKGPPSPVESAWELLEAGTWLRRHGGFGIGQDFVLSFFSTSFPIVSSLLCHSPLQGRGWIGLGCKLLPPAFLSLGGAAQLGSSSGWVLVHGGWVVMAWQVHEGQLLSFQSSFLHSGSTCRGRLPSPSRSRGR